MKKFFILLIIVALLVSLIVTYSGCQTQSEPTKEELENQISSLREELSASEEAVSKLQDELDDKTGEIDELLSEIAEKSTRIEKLETELAELQPEGTIGPRILGVEYYHSKGWHITLDDFASDNGWNLLQIDAARLTYDYLKQQEVSILYIPDVKIAYSEDEINDIVKFVEDGGGLLLIAPEYRSLTDEISQKFSVRIDLDYLGNNRTMTVQPYHPLAEGVATILLDQNTSFLTPSPPAYDILQPIIRQVYRPLIAAGEIGNGRFIVFPQYFDMDAADNSQFLRNIFYWLEQENLP